MLQRFFFWNNILTQRIEPFSNMTQRIEPFFEHDSQKLSKYNSKNWFFPSNMTHKTQGIESSLSEWLEDLNFLLKKTQRIKPFLKKKKMTRRIDLLKNINQIIETFWWLKELNFC